MLFSAVQQCDKAVTVHISPPSWAFLSPYPHPTPSRSSQSTKLSSLCILQFPTSYLFYIWSCICFSAILSICPTFSFPCCVHKSFLYICVSIPAMQIGWSVPFSRFHINLFFSFWLTSFCMTDFRFIRLTSQVALVVKNLSAKAGDTRNASSIPGSERSPGGGHGNPLQYSCLENPRDGGAWWAAVYGITHSHTWLKWLSSSSSKNVSSILYNPQGTNIGGKM